MSLSQRSRPARSRPAPALIVVGLVVAVVLLVLAFALVTGVDLAAAGRAAVSSMYPPAPVTSEAVEINNLYNIVFLIAAAIFIAVEALIVWTVVRYRRRPGDDELPAQVHGNNLAEALWTIIPTVIVAFLFFISWQTLNSVEAVSDEPGVQVRARAGQFQWTFDYLAADGQTVEFTQFLPTGDQGGMAVPVGQPVKVFLDSPDVIHAFYVPHFLFKKDVIPGQTNVFDFTINESEAGQTFRGQCAELCGSGHNAMIFDVHAMTQADFDAWYAAARESAQPSAEPSGSLPPNSVTLEQSAEGVEFDKLQLEAPADQPFAIHFQNRDENIPHDIAITGDEGLLFNGEDLTTVGETTYQVPALEVGDYTFICTFHSNMTGTLAVR